MPPPNLPFGPVPPALMSGGMVNVPSPAQVEEAKKVMGMNVRTNAANMATQLMAGQPVRLDRWWAVAKGIEEFIKGGSFEDAPAARVPPGQED